MYSVNIFMNYMYLMIVQGMINFSVGLVKEQFRIS